MDLTTIISCILTLAILIAYVNHRFIRLPMTIAIMLASMLLSLVLILIGHFGQFPFEQELTEQLYRIPFKTLLMDGMLSYLLFAGGLSVDLSKLKKERWEVVTFATLSTIASCFIIGFATYFLLNTLGGPQVDLIYCLLFGALISPTDPIAVLAIFKEVKAPAEIGTRIAAESLFNDGVGIVIFLVLSQSGKKAKC